MQYVLNISMTILIKSAILTYMEFYIAQVETGRENSFIENINNKKSELALKHKFIYLTRELFIRHQGKIIKEQQPVFPSYIIVQSESAIDNDTLLALKQMPEFYHFLNSNTDITPLSGADLALIKHFMGLGPKIGSSLVRFDENDRIVVIEGPLKGIEGSIIKVDKRKQRAKIRVEFAGTAHTMDLSFEDIEKK